MFPKLTGQCCRRAAYENIFFLDLRKSHFSPTIRRQIKSHFSPTKPHQSREPGFSRLVGFYDGNVFLLVYGNVFLFGFRNLKENKKMDSDQLSITLFEERTRLRQNLIKNKVEKKKKPASR
jgi:hypothetical protein